MGSMVTALCRSLDRSRFQPVVVLPRSSHVPAWPLVATHRLPFAVADCYDAGDAEVWLLSNALLDGVIYPEPFEHAGIKKTDEYGERVADVLGLLGVDVVHLHDAYGYKCLYEARRLRLPTVMTIHRLHEDEPPLAFAELAAASLVDRLTTVSHAYLKERADFFSARADVAVVANGIDLSFWSEENLTPVAGGHAREARRRELTQRLELPDRPTFAFIGRLDRDQKGIDVLTDALEKHLPEAPLNLLFVGEGDRELTERVATLARTQIDRVRFLNRMMSPREVRELLGAVDSVVIPSRYEPFGLIQLEAMAMGALPIASRVGGLGEVLLEEPAVGRCFEVGDAAGLARAMQEMTARLASPSGTVESLRKAAYARANAYSFERMARSYEALYASLTREGEPCLPS
jgi:glycogen synthase